MTGIVDRILSEAFLQNARRFGTAHMILVAFIVLLREFKSPIITPEWGLAALLWLIVNALASPFVATLRPFTTPAVRNPHCNYCDSMIVTGLKCPQCGSEATPPKPED